ncbi:hypothetical protein KY290_033586 [Solanum tuberosum]|uniref:Uncharacterized protein n=1 Tax=Solanum tuberosum TaxID=4113 RepID=A0ABQ7U256_SOLTU|nr:hypothetical protein KY289_032961 [Solanum tuberosum]KAH0740543.1 hypothetical protein KY290_033586 [Solanum tuberosum]
MFTNDQDILTLTSLVFPIIGLCEIGNCPQTTGCGVLRGTARPKVGSHLPSIATAKAKVVGAGAILRPVSSGKQPMMMKNMHISNDSETADVSAILPPEKKRKGRGKTTWLSTQKKRKENDNGKLKVIIPPDRTVAVGPGAKDFITELSVKVLHNARHDVKNWKGVPDLAKNKIVAYMLRDCKIPKRQLYKFIP